MSTEELIALAESYLRFFDEQPERYIGARGIVRALIAEVRRLQGNKTPVVTEEALKDGPNIVEQLMRRRRAPGFLQ